MDTATRKSYPSDVRDEEWHFVLPYLTLMRADAPQRRHDLRWLVRTRAQWAYLPHRGIPRFRAVRRVSPQRGASRAGSLVKG
jgi:transposase